MSGSLRANGTDALGPGTHQINMAAALPQSRYASVVAVGATDVDPSQYVWRPRPAPAAVVGGVGEGHTNECKAMVAVMEEPAVMHKPGMRKTRTREAATCETDATACETHAAGTHPAAHATEMHSTSMHPPMHAATTTMTTAAAAKTTMTAAAAASERGWRKRKRH